MNRQKFKESMQQVIDDPHVIAMSLTAYDLGAYHERNDCIQDCRETKTSFSVFRHNPLHDLSVDHCIERIRKRWEGKQ